MNADQRKSILTIALYAAFADGAKHDREREEIRRIAESFASDDDGPDLTHLYQDVLLKRVTLQSATAALDESGLRQLAYEMAVCVCDADGRQSAVESAFLKELKSQLQLAGDQVAAFEEEVDTFVRLSEEAVPVKGSVPGTISSDVPVKVVNGELDKSILNHAILNGALELLPQSWASMAIIPLQIKMVYRIGKDYGYELDRGHIKDFLATLGVGMTSQYIEQFGRKLIGGLFRKAAGKSMGRIGRTATGVAFSFATTYALGQVARRYYAGGRTMSTELLNKTFAETLGSAKQMQQEYLPQIEQKAQTLDMGQVMGMVRGRSTTSR